MYFLSYIMENYTKCVEGEKVNGALQKWKDKIMTKYGPCDNKKYKAKKNEPEDNALSRLLKNSKSIKEASFVKGERTRKIVRKESL